MKDQQIYGTLAPSRPDLLLYVKENLDRELEKVNKDLEEFEKKIILLKEKRTKLRILKEANDTIVQHFDKPEEETKEEFNEHS